MQDLEKSSKLVLPELHYRVAPFPETITLVPSSCLQWG